MRWLGPWLCAAALAMGCRTPSRVVVDADPTSGARTAYTTVFLDARSRIVLSAAVGEAAPVRLTLWTPAAGEDARCSEVALAIDGQAVVASEVEAQIVETPSDADQTVQFSFDVETLARAAEGGERLSTCGKTWPLDAEDRAVIRQLLDAAAGRSS